MDEKALFTKFWTNESKTRSFLFDIVHHRGQITTYLRPNGVDGAADLRAERRRAVAGKRPRSAG